MDQQHELNAGEFGDDFLWGVAMAAVQNEGAWNSYGKGPSIWDTFSRRQGKIKGRGKPTVACDFYHRYKDDILLAKALGFSVFRFSLSWARLLPDGVGGVNKEGVLFYHKIIEECHQLGLIPFVTLYHWDLPVALEKEGGWTSHLMLRWFSRFATLCATEFGPAVKDWIVLNEPFGFTSLGYMLGRHAPGRIGLSNFLPAIHHAALAQAEGGRIIRQLVPGGVPRTAMRWEINPDSFYRILKRFWLYGGVKKIIVTESGAAFKDEVIGGVVDDKDRVAYYQQFLLALLRARKEGVNVKGFFAWTLMDNFEWAEGYKARFGLIHVDFETQLRTIKRSGYWFRDWLNGKKM